MEREDCFAYELNNEIPKCNALKKLYCRKNTCNFFKTREQVEKEIEKCEERLYELGGIDTTEGYISTKEVSKEKSALASAKENN